MGFPYARKLPRGRFYLKPGHLFRSLRPRPSEGLMTRGAEVTRFEEAFARYLGARHAVAAPFARTAFYYLLRALDLPPGSEILMPPLTVADMVNMVLVAGHVPVFVDIGPRTGNLDPEDAHRKLTPRTRALLLTPLSGIPCAMGPITEFAREHRLVLIEDGSQSIGARFEGRPVGRLGRAGFFSLSSLKPLSTFYGGMLVTDDDDLAAIVRRLMSHQTPRRWTDLIMPIARDVILDAVLRDPIYSLLTHHGVRALATFDEELVRRLHRGNQNYTREKDPVVVRRTALPPLFDVAFSNYQARVGLAAMEDLAIQTERRAALGTFLDRQLRAASVPGLPEIPAGAAPSYWRFPLWVEDRPRWQRDLRARGIDTAVSGLVCASREPVFSDLAAHTPGAFEAMDNMLYLPIHSEMSYWDMERIAREVAALAQMRM